MTRLSFKGFKSPLAHRAKDQVRAHMALAWFCVYTHLYAPVSADRVAEPRRSSPLHSR
jgi:hypothetical protein